MIGALIMTHGDEKGLVLPPKVAPIQVAIIPIIKSGFNVDLINKFVAETASKLESAGLRIEILDDPDKSPGSKFFECEYRGIPYRLEVGPKDVEKNAVMVVPRLRFEPDVIKESVPVEKIVQYLTEKMDLFQIKLYDRAQEFSDTNNFQAESLDEVGKKLERGLGFFTVAWCQNKDCEERLKSIKATSRVVLNNKLTGRKCFVCTKGASSEIIVAKAY
jgi:prolyl-tRNA synthetase